MVKNRFHSTSQQEFIAGNDNNLSPFDPSSDARHLPLRPALSLAVYRIDELVKVDDFESYLYSHQPTTRTPKLSLVEQPFR